MLRWLLLSGSEARRFDWDCLQRLWKPEPPRLAGQLAWALQLQPELPLLKREAQLEPPLLTRAHARKATSEV
jgi:hypothetical protein